MEENNKYSLEGMKRILDNEREQKVVAFVDILGFKNKVRNNDSGIRMAMAYIWKFCHDAKKDFHIYSFSDCIYMVADESKLDKVLELIAVIQRSLFDTGISEIKKGVVSDGLSNNVYLLRGGITKGKVYSCQEENILYGEAVNRAYELESEYAKYPGILLDRTLCEEPICKEYTYKYECNDDFQVGEKCSREKIYFDYFKFLIKQKNDTTLDLNEINKQVEKEMNGVKQKIKEAEKVNEKLEWFLEYSNKTMKAN